MIYEEFTTQLMPVAQFTLSVSTDVFACLPSSGGGQAIQMIKALLFSRCLTTLVCAFEDHFPMHRNCSSTLAYDAAFPCNQWVLLFGGRPSQQASMSSGGRTDRATVPYHCNLHFSTKLFIYFNRLFVP